jgi:hypothetical protein
MRFWIELDKLESIGDRMIELAQRQVRLTALRKGRCVGRFGFEAS